MRGSGKETVTERKREYEGGRDGEQRERERVGVRLLHARIPHFIAG